METKKEKIDLVKDLMVKLGVTPQEMVNELRADLIKSTTKLVKGDTVCIGMYWYADNTFSFGLLPKPIKAVVEYIDDEFIYGDLTASSLIGEVLCSYNKGNQGLFCIGDVMENSAYKCEADETMVCYSYNQMEKVSVSYARVQESLKKIGKAPRRRDTGAAYWTSDTDGYFQRMFAFGENWVNQHWKSIVGEAYYRPVLRWKYN